MRKSGLRCAWPSGQVPHHLTRACTLGYLFSVQWKAIDTDGGSDVIDNRIKIPWLPYKEGKSETRVGTKRKVRRRCNNPKIRGKVWAGSLRWKEVDGCSLYFGS